MLWSRDLVDLGSTLATQDQWTSVAFSKAVYITKWLVYKTSREHA